MENVIECSVEECSKNVHSKSLCQMHYRRLRNHGNTDSPTRRNKPGPKSDPTKPYSKHKPSKLRVYEEVTECPSGHPYNEENTYVDGKGYKHCRTCSKERMAEIRSKNSGPGRGSYNKTKLECPKGHSYNEENTIWSKDHKRRSCRKCYVNNYPKRAASKYGITPEIVQSMVEKQNNCCAICKVEFNSTPHIDHDHACCDSQISCGDCVRGLLCVNCNAGLGWFKDSILSLKSAIFYLKQYSCDK